MQTNTYLFFNGNCKAAFEHYERHLGGTIDMMITADEAPADMPAQPGFENNIMHARMQLADNVLMGSDAPPNRYNKPQGFDVNITVDTPEEAERIFNALAENGEVHMPLEKTFWAERFGALVDQFGIPWMVNCE
ncbi:MAG TPA: VOC family protein [Gammaproteobacteria bacterium]|nr:VOC family protein [Gammaproteobacteria bacterium]